MSKRIGTLYHPGNNEPADIYEGFSWPCLFFCSIWYAVKGMWMWAIASFFIVSSTCGLAWFIFPFFANGMHKKHLRQSGWLTEEQTRATAPREDSRLLASQAHPAKSIAPVPRINSQNLTMDLVAIRELPQNDEKIRSMAAFDNPSSQQPQPARSLNSNSFIFAKLENGISWKNEYDVLDAEAGSVLFELREGEQGAVGKVARMGTLATTTGFDIMFKTIHGHASFRVVGGGMKGGGEVYNGSDVPIGRIKRAHLASMNFEGIDTQGHSKFMTKSKGFGVLTFSHDIIQRGIVVGKIKDIDNSTAKTILGNNFPTINAFRKYDYAYQLSLTGDIDDLDKALLFGTVYCIAHISGRI